MSGHPPSPSLLDYVYFTDQVLRLFVTQMKLQSDPYYFVSRKGVLPTPVASATATATPARKHCEPSWEHHARKAIFLSRSGYEENRDL